MARYFYAPVLEIGSRIHLSPDESCHVKADRIAPGREVLLGDGRGRLVSAVHLGWQDGRAMMEVLSPADSLVEPVKLRCCIALIKSQSRLDWAVEKLTELGAGEIVVFPAARSVRHSLSAHRLERMEKIIREAGKQTGRTLVPRLLWLECWDDFIRFVSREGGRIYPAFPEAETTLWQALSQGSTDRTALITGPEGDFTPEEKSVLAAQPRSAPVRLTRNVMRSETALIFGASLLSAFHQDHDEICPQNPRL